jgi:hypothetical protein
MRDQISRGLINIVALAIAAVGCGTELENEVVERVEQPLADPDWMFNLWHGNAGPNPFLAASVCPSGPCFLPVCAALEPDGRWHSGKLWEGNCRYEYANRFAWKNNYAVLQHPASGSLVFQTNVTNGVPPGNAKTTPDGSLPGLAVCRDVGGAGPGKVWGGSCRVEWRNQVFFVLGTSYEFLLKQ